MGRSILLLLVLFPACAGRQVVDPGARALPLIGDEVMKPAGDLPEGTGGPLPAARPKVPPADPGAPPGPPPILPEEPPVTDDEGDRVRSPRREEEPPLEDPGDEVPAEIPSPEEVLLAQVRLDPNPELCETFAASFPRSPHRGEVGEACREARTQRRQLLLSRIRKAPTVPLCDEFLRELAGAPGHLEVRRLRVQAVAWGKAARRDTAAGYRAFSLSYPESPFGPEAEARSEPPYWRRRGEENPDDGKVALQRAVSCLATGRCLLAEVEESFLRALSLSPRSVPARVGVARIALDQGRLEQATEHLEAALALDPSDREAHFLLGKIARRREDCPKALMHFDRALEGRPDQVEVLYMRGRCRLREGGCRWAVEDFRRALALAPPGSRFAPAAAAELRLCGVAGGGT